MDLGDKIKVTGGPERGRRGVITGTQRDNGGKLTAVTFKGSMGRHFSVDASHITTQIKKGAAPGGTDGKQGGGSDEYKRDDHGRFA